LGKSANNLLLSLNVASLDRRRDIRLFQIGGKLDREFRTNAAAFADARNRPQWYNKQLVVLTYVV